MDPAWMYLRRGYMLPLRQVAQTQPLARFPLQRWRREHQALQMPALMARAPHSRKNCILSHGTRCMQGSAQ